VSQIITASAEVFEDTIDGYFPLHESLRQLLERNRIETAIVRIIHAPAMEISGLKRQDPVPLCMANDQGCMIHQMTLIVCLEQDEITVSGAGHWTWTGVHRLNDVQFSVEHRLAEPAFIRGIRLKSAHSSMNFNTSNCNTPPALQDDQLCVPLHASLYANTIVKGQSSVIDRSIFVKPSTPAQCVHHGSITYMVFENNQRQNLMLKEFFSDLK